MKILMLDRAGAQSIWSVMAAIRRAAEEAGHEVTTCRWNDGNAELEDAVPDGARNETITVPLRRRPSDVLRQHLAFAGPFAGVLRRARPDVLITNFIVPGGWAALQAKAAGVPVIVNVRHEDFTSLAAHLRVWTRICGRVADHHVHVSNVVAASYGAPAVASWTGTVAPRHVVIRNGVDRTLLDRIARPARPAGCAPFVIAGRLVKAKGIELALKALATARSRDASLALEIVGSGPLRGQLQDLARRLGIEGHVEFVGWQPKTETLLRMKAARAVLVPSRKEGFGLVLAEAMAMGCPVIASDIPVLREVARFGRGARFFRAGDHGALAEVMLEPLAGSCLTAPMDNAAMANRYVSLMEAALAALQCASRPVSTDC